MKNLENVGENRLESVEKVKIIIFNEEFPSGSEN